MHFFSLVALGYIAHSHKRDDIIECLSGQSWATKHEVLARWGWMCEHRSLLARGVPLSRPYLCRVARRAQDGRNTDREFYQLLTFLHFLRATTSEELLFVAKRDTPDFVLETSGGQLVGLEASEASVSEEWDRERDAESAVLDVIRAQVCSPSSMVHVRKVGSWRPVEKRIGQFESWLCDELSAVALPRSSVHLRNSEYGIDLKCEPTEHGAGFLSWSDVEPTTGSDLERHAQEMQETLRRRIEHKIARRTDVGVVPRRTPSIRPCYLVVYPNHDLGDELRLVVEKFFQTPPIDVASHFDRVWLSGEDHLVPLA